MSFIQAIPAELERLKGLNESQPRTVSFPGDDGLELRIGFTAIDTLSCAFREISLDVPALVGCSFDVLKKWAEALSQRITYLLEDLGPLELDPNAGQVLMRSIKPDTRGDSRSFYEVLLESKGQGVFALRRYRSVAGNPGRDQVDVQVTHEVLVRLAEDLVETIPVAD